MEKAVNALKHGDFTPLAENYSKYRPGYSDMVIDTIIKLVNKSPENIDFVDLTDIIDRDLPLTMLAPDNNAWRRITFGTLEGGTIIKRHLSRGLFFCDVLHNETIWFSVDDEPFAIEERGENNEHLYIGGAYLYKCDIFARNGIMHYVDRVIGEPYDTVPPTTSPAPTITDQPTAYVPPTAAPVPTPGAVPIFLPPVRAPVVEDETTKNQNTPTGSAARGVSVAIATLMSLAV